jgi:hypothetical protein
MTLTNEPFQPVRFYYSIPSRASITKRLRGIECMVEAPQERCWHWLFEAEAASLRFAGGYDDVPQARRPIILGRIRFPSDGSMTLQTNSVQRAIGAAGFFASCLGPEAVLIRCRLVNRFFAAEEGRLDELMNNLDRNVTVIDPREAEAAFRREFRNVKTKEDAERIASESMERRLKSGEDVPVVEDLPLAPEEETSEFTHLTMTLQLRLIRAMEHWRGNTDVTLTALIVHTFK